MLYFVNLDQKIVYNCEFLKKLSAITINIETFHAKKNKGFLLDGVHYRLIDNFLYMDTDTKINEALCLPTSIFFTFINQITNTSSYAIIYDGYNLLYIPEPSQELLNKLSFYQDKDIIITTNYQQYDRNMINSFMTNRPGIHQLNFLIDIFCVVKHDLETVQLILDQDQIGHEYIVNYNGFRVLPCNKIAAYGVGDPQEYILHQKAFWSLFEQYKNNWFDGYQRTEIVVLGNYATLKYDNGDDPYDLLKYVKSS